MSNSFGTPKFGGDGEFYKRFKLRQPDVSKGEDQVVFICKIMPPMHSYRDSGRWAFFYGTHWGYKGVNPKDPTKGLDRSFGCIQQKDKNKMIVKACPECDLVAEKKNAKEAREKELQSKGLSKDDIKADLKIRGLADFLQRHNCEKRFHMNVMTPDGSFGVLRISFRTWEKLQNVIKTLKEKKMEPLDPMGGVWFQFTTTGTFLKKEDAVDVVKDKINHPELGEVEKIKLAPMTEEQIDKAFKILPDLSKDIVSFISAEAIKALTTCSGAPDEVDRIMGKKVEQPVQSESHEDDDDHSDHAEESGKSQETSSEAVAIEARRKAILERKAREAAETAAKEAAAAAAAKVQTSVDPTTMSEEEFLAKFGI